MTTYTTITDLIQREIAPAIATDDTLTGDQCDRIAAKVCTRLQAAGLVMWHDGYDEDRGAYWLPAQGFRMVDPGDDGATFWGIVSDVLADQDGED